MPKKVVPIILASLFGLSTIAIARDDLVQSPSNPTLASIEIEVSDAVNVSFASAYWRIAKRLRHHTDRDLENLFWSRADETLSRLSEPNADVAEVRRILAYERDHPDSISGWYDRERHSKWSLQPGYMGPIDVLNKTYYGSSRRTCRVVAAIILEKAVAALRQLESAPTPGAYWTLYASEEALRDAMGACPDPGSTEDRLRTDILGAGFQLRRVLYAHGDAFLPPERERPKSGLDAILFNARETRVVPNEAPIITSAELLAASDRITEQSIKVWKAGPDNLIVRTWDGIRMELLYWPD